jgi:hypothetical protein
METFVPRLVKREGATVVEIILVDNPQKAFAWRP